MGIKAQTVSHTSSTLVMLRLLLTSSRPVEWVKNIFLFAPVFFSKNLLDPEKVFKILVAFCLYCMVAAAIYLMNDIFDREEDRTHPWKSMRPIASGALAIRVAASASVFLALTSLGGAYVLGLHFGLVTTAYVVLNVLYSGWLKHAVILDVFAIATGFVFRVVAGGVVIGVEVSHWLLICTMLLSLFLGFSKRRHELANLADSANQYRRVLAHYNPVFLDIMISIVTSATVVGYTLYTISVETVNRFHTDKLILTVPFVLYGIFRYLYLVYHKSHGGNPAQDLLTDKPLLLNILMWGILSGIIIYCASA